MQKMLTIKRWIYFLKSVILNTKSIVFFKINSYRF